MDTTADTLKVKWEDHNFGEMLDYYYWESYIHIWDDDGQIYSLDCPLGYHIPPDGELSFAYAKTYVNVHAEVRWFYQIVGHYWGFTITVKCDLYVGSSSSGGQAGLRSIIPPQG